MKIYSFYHKETGFFNGRTFSSTDETAIERNTLEQHTAIEGNHDHLCRRVDLSTGKIIAYQPTRPSENHEWNPSTERWVLSSEYQSKLDAHHQALRKIAMLEVSQPRYIREHTLGTNPKALERLQAIENEIIELRKSIMQELLK